MKFNQNLELGQAKINFRYQIFDFIKKEAGKFVK